MHGALRFLHQSSRRLQLASPGRSTATHHSVSKLLGDLETPALHPSLTLPHLITRIPAQQQRLSQTDGERRAALLALIGLPDDRLLPARWDFVQHEHVWVLLMHARCDLPVHVDYSATGSTRRPHPPAAPPGRTPTPVPFHPPLGMSCRPLPPLSAWRAWRSCQVRRTQRSEARACVEAHAGESAAARAARADLRV